MAAAVGLAAAVHAGLVQPPAGLRLPMDGDAAPGKDDLADHLGRHVERFELPVRLGCRVESLARDGGLFVVRGTGGAEWRARAVVLASVAHTTPVVPPLADRLAADVVALHSSSYRRPSQLPRVPTLVAGAGNSGAEIALELARDRPVRLAGRDVGHVPVLSPSRPSSTGYPALFVVGLPNQRVADLAPGRRCRGGRGPRRPAAGSGARAAPRSPVGRGDGVGLMPVRYGPAMGLKRAVAARLDRRYARLRDVERLRHHVERLRAGTGSTDGRSTDAEAAHGRPLPTVAEGVTVGPPLAAAALGERRLQIFQGLLRVLRPGRLVDIGAGHGKFSVLAADEGWDVTAVDARDERFPPDPRVAWVRQDVREHVLEGYDLIVCLGLMYHLTLDDQLDLLRRAAGIPLIIDTHLDTGRPTQPLSEQVTINGYTGRMFVEETQYATASWGNRQSFWATVPDFHRMLNENGYPTILTVEPWYQSDRTFFLALPG